ncbi:hypothetical protein LK10_03955 [Sinomonas humi]|uniref:HNH nuclease domain-containing protein n=1 Tax=Sinomonas humi TaxID=1338436 RepID=A0A0B2AN13_9MICC|nr:hypothetical protein LK10_03955 [Sinomonas humi]
MERVRLACEEEARRAQEAAEVGRGERGEAGPPRFGGDVGRALAVSEVAVAGEVSEFVAARLLGAAEALCGAQLAVLARLEAGDLTEAHARVIADETATLPEAVAERFGIECLSRLETRTGRRRSPGEFRKAVRSLRERLHPESIRARKVRAERDRGVWVRPEPDGMCTLSAFVPAEIGLAAFTRLDALARGRRDADPEEGRTLPQLRADEFAAFVLAGPGACSGPMTCPETVGCPDLIEAPSSPAASASPMDGPSTPVAEIVVHISVESLLGASQDPAVLEGYGPIDAATARELAAAAPTWQRLLETREGVALSLGRSAYRPPRGLRRFIRYRDGTCQFPGCQSPAARAEIDHMVEWQDGGVTDAANLHALCRKHHALKSLRLWQPHRLRNEDNVSGDTLWVSPLGARAITGPADHELGKSVVGETGSPSRGAGPSAGEKKSSDGCNSHRESGPPPF